MLQDQGEEFLIKSMQTNPCCIILILFSLNHISLDDFEIIKFLGKGAYGTVMLAKKKVTGDYYAIKMVDLAGKVTFNYGLIV